MKVDQLFQAIGKLERGDAHACKLTLADWQALVPYLSTRFLHAGDPLMREGDSERELFILAEGELVVSVGGNAIATLQPGTVVGEGTFFSGEPRSATVTPHGPGVAWSLHWDKFEELSTRNPKLAVDLVKWLAAVLAVRMRAALLVGHFA